MNHKITPTKFKMLFKNVFFGIVLLLTGNLFAVPVITSVSPTRITFGSTVTITGSGFTNSTATTVTINGTTSGFTITSKSTTSIVIEITASKTGAVTVTVTGTGAGVATSVSPYLLTFVTPINKSNTSSNIRINRIFTDYNTFWAGPPVTGPATQPNTSHQLLGFSYNGTTYSTGVDDTKLTPANGVASFTPQKYRAFSTRGVLGKTHSDLFLATADLIDGTMHNALGNPSSPNIAGLTAYDVLIDGINGLDLGTGVTNFNKVTTIDFVSNFVQTGPANTFFGDNIPDVLLTQIAQPNGTDVYYFKDVNDNVVGTPVSITMEGAWNPSLGSWRLDLFKFTTGIDIEVATPIENRVVDTRTREIRMLGMRLSDFDIDSSNYSDVYSLAMNAGGGSDLAFMAYNTESFKIPSPEIVSTPLAVNICKLPSAGSVTFSVGATVPLGAGGPFYQWKKDNIAIPGATSNTYTIPGPIVDSTPFATYKVEVYNSFGAIVATSAVLRLGGAQTTWNGSSWSPVSPPTSGNSLVFTNDYDSSTHLVGTELKGCDCTILNDVDVIVDSNDTMILQNFIEIIDEAPIYQTDPITGDVILDINGDPIIIGTIPAGKLTIKDKGSLVQINETVNNIGEITYKRKATNLKTFDYVYWSSPVSNFNINGLASASNPKIYSWNPNFDNGSNFGNWEDASGVMEVGKGYISRVSNGSDFTVNFSGVPNNGIYNKTITGTANPDSDDDYWNLIGNPYPSPINATAFLSSNSAIEGSLQIWTHDTAIGSYTDPYYQDFTYNYKPTDYITVNGMTSVPLGFNGYIAAGQGFFVKGKTSSGTVTFNNLLRYKSGFAAYNNGQFYKKSDEEIEKSLIWLSLLNSVKKISTSIAVGYIEDATLDKDDLYDTPIFSENEFELFSIINNNDEKYIIQGRPSPFDSNDVIPLGFKVSNEGNYTIVIDKTIGVFESDQEIFLEDKYLNVVHDLKLAPYNFVADKGSFKDRFALKYTNTALGVNDFKTLNAVAFIANNKLTLSTVEAIKSFAVYDISGKLILNHSFDSNNVKEFYKDFNYTQGVYLVKIKLINGEIVTKKLIK